MKNQITRILFISIMASIFFLGSCKKEELEDNSNNISVLIGKLETEYKEGDFKLESGLSNGEIKIETRAPEEYLNTIKSISEQDSKLVKKSTRSLVGLRVGVLREYGQTCGSYDYLDIYMDCEDDRNSNNKNGWIGATFLNSNITFRLCLVPKDLFSHSKYFTYAVLSLNEAYIDYSELLEKYFDNEDSGNSNWVKLNGVKVPKDEIQATIGDGLVQNTNTTLFFQVYEQNITNGTTSFPNLGIHYGVFGYMNDRATGWVWTDDEDDKNANKMWYNWWYIPKAGNEGWEQRVKSIIDVGDGRNKKKFHVKNTISTNEGCSHKNYCNLHFFILIN